MQKVGIASITNIHAIFRIRLPSGNSLATQIASVPCQRTMALNAGFRAKSISLPYADI